MTLTDYILVGLLVGVFLVGVLVGCLFRRELGLYRRASGRGGTLDFTPFAGDWSVARRDPDDWFELRGLGAAIAEASANFEGGAEGTWAREQADRHLRELLDERARRRGDAA